MSVESLSAVLHHSRAKGTAKLVAVGIANHDGDGGAWPTVSTLARYANCDARSVQRALSKLSELGELTITQQGGGTAGLADHERPNLYHLHVSCPPWCDRSTQHRDTRQTRQSNLRGLPGDISATPRRQRQGVGVTPASLGGVTPAPPKPPTQPDPTSVSAQVAAAREAERVSCETCHAPDWPTCKARQVKLAPGDQHSYRAKVRRASA